MFNHKAVKKNKKHVWPGLDTCLCRGTLFLPHHPFSDLWTFTPGHKSQSPTTVFGFWLLLCSEESDLWNVLIFVIFSYFVSTDQIWSFAGELDPVRWWKKKLQWLSSTAMQRHLLSLWSKRSSCIKYASNHWQNITDILFYISHVKCKNTQSSQTGFFTYVAFSPMVLMSVATVWFVHNVCWHHEIPIWC